jgi:arylsulfatase A-like enzyme
MNISKVVLAVLVSFTVSCQSSVPNNDSPKRPNILMIVVDDLGYTDIGSFGGDIATPNLDLLASTGLTFSRFHTAPVCAVTRSMLLSGNDNHIAGMGSQSLVTGEFGYEGHLSNRIVPLPSLLKEAGYHTSMVGKWHLGKTPDQNPKEKGFDQSFALLTGAGNHYSNRGLFASDPISPYTENGVSTDWPEGAYSTDLYTEKLISFIDKYKDDNQPFFAFAAYTTPHWPLQVDSVYWQKYEGQYDGGYEELRNVRFENLKELDLIPKNAVLPELHPGIKPWNSLTKEEKKSESRKMELYAGMVHNMDVNIGRLVDYLKETNQFDNTMIVFFSDNGAAAEDFYNNEDYGPFLQEHYTVDYETMGTEESFISYGPQWAEAGASPFKYFKGYTTQGGINTPFIISGPSISTKGKVTHAFTTLMDVAPTFYELAQTEYPATYNEREVYPLKGSSMMPLLLGKTQSVHGDDYVFALEHRGRILVRKGNWKLVNSQKPFDESNFELYDLSLDLAEQTDLKKEQPDVYRELISEWEKYRDEVRVQLPTPKSGTGLE